MESHIKTRIVSAIIKDAEKGKLTSTDLLRRDAASSGSIQGDAAAGDEDDGALYGGGGARAVGVRERKKKRQGGKRDAPLPYL